MSLSRDVILDAFDSLDVNKDGVISESETRNAIRALGLPQPARVRAVSRDDFVALVGGRVDELHRTFARMDADGDGTLTRDELRAGLLADTPTLVRIVFSTVQI